MGYLHGVKVYNLWCIDLKQDLKPPKAFISNDVVFNETKMLHKQQASNNKIEKQ